MQEIVSAFSKHNIKLTPAGVWSLIKGKKEAVDAKRIDNLSWDKYAKDNMARHFLTSGILVLDIDGEYSEIDSENNTITIPGLDITIPLSLYSQTSSPGKYHIYYHADTTDLPNRVTKIHGTTCDIFTYGTIFEGHVFSKHYTLHDMPMIDAPEALLKLIDELDIPSSSRTGIITPTTNVQRYNLVTAFLAEKLESRKQWNAFYRSIIPTEYMKPNAKKIDIEDFPLSYDLFNKIAVKLTATAELDYNDHTVPTLYKMLTLWGINPFSDMSQNLMHVNILPSLPQHESIKMFSLSNDDLSFQEHLDYQTATETPVFRTIHNGRLMFLEVDKFSREPIPHGNSYLIDLNTAQALHPERDAVNDEGRVIGWDQNVPIIYTMNSPYEPQYVIDPKHDRHQINLYTPSEYIKQASPLMEAPTMNILYKAVLSTAGSYAYLVLAYHAQIIFGDSSPTMVLWIATLPSEKGGTGKSMLTLTIPSLILQQAATGVDAKTLTSGWGDIVSQVRMLSLEDMTDVTVKEWESVYSVIKQQNTNAYRKLNMKGASILSERIRLAITGSSNFRPKLSPSDRRFLCLEPGHMRGMTEPLTDNEQTELNKLIEGHSISPKVQEYTDYLFGLFSAGFSPEIERALFREAPETPYRSKWINGGATNTQNIINNLSRPIDLHGIVKYDEVSIGELTHLYQFVIHSYNTDTGKAAVPWKWFELLLPYVQADKGYDSPVFSKASISKMLNVDFNNCGIKYTPKWKDGLPKYLPSEWANWPTDGYVFALTPESFKEYQVLVTSMLSNTHEIIYPEEV